jgi:hypothetical protein
MYETTKEKLISKEDEAKKIEKVKPSVQNYSVEPDPEVIENDEIQSSKNSSESMFLKEGTPINILT